MVHRSPLCLASLALPLLSACSSSSGSATGSTGSPDAGGADATSADDGGAGDDGGATGGRDARASKDAAGTGKDGGGQGEGGQGTLTPGTTTLMLTVDGVARTAILHVPSGAQPMPLVLALHGDGDTAQNFAQTSGLLADSDAEGFVLAALQGITRSVAVHDNGKVVQTIPGIDWDPYNAIDGSGNVVATDNEDVPFLDAVRSKLAGSGSIDLHHVIVYGYSQGGYMSLRYGMSDAADLACAAVLAAADPMPGTTLITGASRKIPVFLQIGTQDSAYSNAQSTEQELQKNGNPTMLVAVQGAGHVPIPGDPKKPLDWCLMQKLP